MGTRKRIDKPPLLCYTKTNNTKGGGDMETILYEFSFDYVKGIGFFIILVIGVAFFFADKIFGTTKSFVDPKVKEISPAGFKIIVRSIGVFCFVIFLIFSFKFLLIGYCLTVFSGKHLCFDAFCRKACTNQILFQKAPF